MIRQFLKGLPSSLTKPMFGEYESKCRELSRWSEHSKSPRVKPYLKNLDAIQYIFAIGIYYRYVIAPLSGSSKLIERLEASNVQGIRVGGKPLGVEFKNSIESGAQYFNNVITRFGLPEPFFAQTEVPRIVMSLIELEERRAREQG